VLNNFWAQSAKERQAGGATTAGVTTTGGMESGAAVTTVVSTTGAAGVNGRTVAAGGATDGDVPDVDAPAVAVVATGERDGDAAPLDESGIESELGVDANGSEASVAESAANETVDVTRESDGAADESDPLVRLHTTMAIPRMNTPMETGVRSFRGIAGKYQVLQCRKTGPSAGSDSPSERFVQRRSNSSVRGRISPRSK